MCKLGVISQERFKLLSSANVKSYMPRRFAQKRMTLSDLEWLVCGFCHNCEPSHTVTNIYVVHIKWKSLQNDDTVERIKR